MKTRNSALVLLAALALLVVSVPGYASKMDDRIESSARKSYVFKTYLQSDDIKIQSREGVVTLTGMVSADYHKRLAHQTVEGLPGVKRVDDRLEVKGTSPTANSDAWLRDKVKVTLLLHNSVRGSTTEVDVKDGIVTLRGDASSQGQKELTTEYAKDIEGIKDVVNQMTVTQVPRKERTAGETIDDASITSQVKMSLLYHRSTSALDTKVKTRRGVVTLFGTASSEAQLNMTTRIARDVNGVKEVKNRMSIE